MSKMNINQCTVTLTRKCNLRCNFCYAKKTKYLENDILEYNNLKILLVENPPFILILLMH